MIICVVLMVFIGPLIVSNIASQAVINFFEGIWNTFKSVF